MSEKEWQLSEADRDNRLNKSEPKVGQRNDQQLADALRENERLRAVILEHLDEGFLPGAKSVRNEKSPEKPQINQEEEIPW